MRQELLNGELAPFLRQRVGEVGERAVERLLRDPEVRRQLASEVAERLEARVAPSGRSPAPVGSARRPPAPRRRTLLAVAALAVLAAAAILLAAYLRPWGAAAPDAAAAPAGDTAPESTAAAAAPPALADRLADRLRAATPAPDPERVTALAERIACWLPPEAAASLARLAPERADAAAADALFGACAAEEPPPAAGRFSPAAFAAQAAVQPLLRRTADGAPAWPGWPPAEGAPLPRPEAFAADGLAGPTTHRVLNRFLEGAGSPLRLDAGSPAPHYLLAAVLALRAGETA